MKSKRTQRGDANCATYLFNALYDAKANLKEAKKNLKGVLFDTIVVTGISGVAFGIPLAAEMKKNIVIVRKPQDGSHSHRQIESNVELEGIGNWIFVDDLIETGKTVKRVKSKLFGYYGSYVGRYLYDNHEFASDQEEQAGKQEKPLLL